MLKLKVKTSIIFLVFVLMTVSACSKKYSQTTINGTVAYSIHLLETSQYEKLFATIADPNAIGSVKDLKFLVKHFRKRKAKKLLQILKRLGDTRLITKNGVDVRLVSKSSTKEKFEVKNERPITFIKIGNKWHIGA